MIAMEMGKQYDVDRVVGDAETLQGNKARGPEIDAEANARRIDPCTTLEFIAQCGFPDA